MSEGTKIVGAAYKELRYADLKQIIEAVLAFYDHDMLEDNATFEQMECEFNFIADELGYEDVEAMLDRLIANDERDVGGQADTN